MNTTIPGRARPKARPRATGRGGFVRIYTPTSKHEKQVADQLTRFAGRFKGKRELGVCLKFVNPVSRSDADNLAKLMLDALVKASVIDDDRYVLYLETHIDRDTEKKGLTMVEVFEL